MPARRQVRTQTGIVPSPYYYLISPVGTMHRAPTHYLLRVDLVSTQQMAIWLIDYIAVLFLLTGKLANRVTGQLIRDTQYDSTPLVPHDISDILLHNFLLLQSIWLDHYTLQVDRLLIFESGKPYYRKPYILLVIFAQILLLLIV